MKQDKLWLKLLFAAYCVLMLWLLFGQRMASGGVQEIQIVPFRTLRLFWNVLLHHAGLGLRRQAIVNLLGNVIMFVPLGFFIPWFWKFAHKFWRHFLLMTAVIVAVELSQYVFRLGTCDIDDLILNLVGTTLGFVLWKFAGRLMKRNH